MKITADSDNGWPLEKVLDISNVFLMKKNSYMNGIFQRIKFSEYEKTEKIEVKGRILFIFWFDGYFVI